MMRTVSVLKPVAIGLSGLMVAGLSFFSGGKKYTPRNTNAGTSAFAGAADYYHWLKQDPTTGKLNFNAMVEEMNGRASFANAKTSSSLGLVWNEMGPDNIGGRTRAIIVDKNNTNRLFCGTVSGGIFRSDNAGTTWSVINDQMSTLIVSCAAQDGDGNLYFGTGEGMARGGNGDGNSAFIGAGMYKMDYNASTDSYSAPTVIASTVPTPNTAVGTTNWLYINKIAISPTKVNGFYVIYAATSRGLEVSQDGGATWSKALSSPASNYFVTDVDVCNDGTVYCTSAGSGGFGNGGGKVFKSPATGGGLPGSFTEITPSAVSTGNFGRSEIAPSKTNPNIVYLSVSKPVLSTSGAVLASVLQSVDGGTSWTAIATGTTSGGVVIGFEPFASYGQGDYDHVLEVFPDNDYSILLGGVDFYKWDAVDPVTQPPYNGQWGAFGDQFSNPQNLNYIHADKHAITFHPSNPNIIYFGTDGGVFKTTSKGYPFAPMNKGLNATQFYAVAYERDALWSYGPDAGTFNGAGVFGGTQDNGTPYISGNLNTLKSGESINGGDGFYTEASMLSPKVFFYTSYYGYLERTADRSANGADFYPANRPTMLCTSAKPGEPAFASFNTPISLWETGNLANSADSVEFIVDSLRIPSVTLANGTQTTFSFTITKPQTAAVITPGTIVITAANQVVTSDVSNNLWIGGSQVGTYNPTSNIATVTFPTAPVVNTPIKVVAAITYNTGDVLSVTSGSLNMKFNYTLTSNLTIGDTIKIMDPIQARLGLGLNGAVYVCKNPLNFNAGATPVWIKVAGSTSRGSNGSNNAFSGYVQTLEWGGVDYLYVATSAGYLWRIKNLSQLVDHKQDIDNYNPTSDTYSCTQNPQSPVRADIIGGFSGRSITSIAVDPTNPDRVVITLGNYGSTNHVYYCSTATSAPSSTGTSNWTPVLSIAQPVYSSTFIQTSYGQTNPNAVLFGTETGVVSVDDITAPTAFDPAGNNAGGMFPNVPTFMLRQQTLGNWECYNSGMIYAATHGRGIWKSENYYSPFVVGINEQSQNSVSTTTKAIKAFPNPAHDYTTVNFTLTDERKISISVYDLKGSKVKTVNCGKLMKGTQNINVELDNMPKGTYIIAVSDENAVLGTCRVITLD